MNGDGMIMACDNLLPQLFGGDGKRKASVVLQKCKHNFDLKKYILSYLKNFILSHNNLKLEYDAKRSDFIKH